MSEDLKWVLNEIEEMLYGGYDCPDQNRDRADNREDHARADGSINVLQSLARKIEDRIAEKSL